MSEKHNPLSIQINEDAFLPASEEDKKSTNLMRPNSTFFKDGVKRFIKNPVAMTAFIFICLLVLAVFLVPLIYPYTYDELLYLRYSDRQLAEFNLLKPFTYAPREIEAMASGEKIWPHLLGTDKQGHDYFIRVLIGARTSLIVGLFAAIIVLVIGGIVGSLCGYIGGKLDLIVMRIVDVIYSLPDILVMILLSTGLREFVNGLPDGSKIKEMGAGFVSIFVVFALLYWVSMARLVRGQILNLRQTEFVMAAKASGGSTSRIIRKHLLPNAISVIIISAALQIPSAIFTESFLSYLGLGVQYPHPSLGSLAADAKSYLSSLVGSTYIFLVPAFAICLIVLSMNLLGDGLRDAFDPKLQR